MVIQPRSQLRQAGLSETADTSHLISHVQSTGAMSVGVPGAPRDMESDAGGLPMDGYGQPHGTL